MEHTIHNQTFGLELEFGKITRTQAIRVLEEHFGNRSFFDDGPSVYEGKYVKDSEGRKWKIVRDSSVNSMNPYESKGSELVTPPLKYEDIETLQELIRKLRKAGAKVDESCGIHIHVGLAPYTAKSIKNLIKFYGKYESMFYKAVQVLPNRIEGYTKQFTKRHSELFNNANSITTMDDIKKLWYGYNKTHFQHYDNSRYSGLNLHNIWYKGWSSGTVEFRFFNATLHAGEIRSYITLILAISSKALNAKSINMREARVVNEEHLFPKVLGGMGITARDPQMKNVYKHLMKHMERNWASQEAQ